MSNQICEMERVFMHIARDLYIAEIYDAKYENMIGKIASYQIFIEQT